MEPKNERNNKETYEYVFNVEMTQEEYEQFTKLATVQNMTSEEYLKYAIKSSTVRF